MFVANMIYMYIFIIFIASPLTMTYLFPNSLEFSLTYKSPLSVRPVATKDGAASSCHLAFVAIDQYFSVFFSIFLVKQKGKMNGFSNEI